MDDRTLLGSLTVSLYEFGEKNAGRGGGGEGLFLGFFYCGEKKKGVPPLWAIVFVP